MKKYYRYAGIMLMLILITVCISIQVSAEPGPYIRSEAVAPEEKNAVSKSKAVSEKAWKRIDGVCYNGSGEPVPGVITRGMDVSSWQGKIDWSKVKNSDIDFVIIRLCHGLEKIDSYYDYNMKNATANGIPVGIYIYSTATTKNVAVKEAKFVIQKAKGYKVSYPIVFDMEDDSVGSLTNGQRSDLAVAFCEEIKKAGYYPMVYTNQYWYLAKLDMSKLKAYDIWLARFGDTIGKPDPEKFRYSIWQCTGGDTTPGMNPTKGLVDGVPSWNNVDLDYGFVDYTKLIKPRMAALASYTASESAKKNGWVTEDGLTYYYKNGKKLTGAQRIGTNEYRFSTKDGHLFTNTLLYSKVTKNVVYCSSSGALVKNQWVTAAGKKYYIGNDCLAYKGSRNVGGKFYWFDKDKKYMLRSTKVITSNGSIYYYGPDGVRVTSGFTKIKEDGKINTYYFNKQGLAYKGWHRIRGKDYWFYGGKSSRAGVRAENTTLTISGYICTFDENGVCVSKTEA